VVVVVVVAATSTTPLVVVVVAWTGVYILGFCAVKMEEKSLWAMAIKF
jgi:hypothetical protein